MYDGDNGFAIGSDDDLGDVGQQDAADVQSLFDVIEHVMVPMFYDRSTGPLPRRWLARVRRSLRTLGPRVLASRMVREYVTDLYVPLADRARVLAADDHARARALSAWRERIDGSWSGVRVVSVTADDSVTAVGARRDVRAEVDLGALRADDVRVEVVHGAVDADGRITGVLIEPMTLDGGHSGAARYHARFRCARSGEFGFTVRIVPLHADLLSVADTGRAVWPTTDAATVEHQPPS